MIAWISCTHANSVHISIVTVEYLSTIRITHVPQFTSSIHTPGDVGFTIGSQGQGTNVAIVSLEFLNFLVSLQVPYAPVERGPPKSQFRGDLDREREKRKQENNLTPSCLPTR